MGTLINYSTVRVGYGRLAESNMYIYWINGIEQILWPRSMFAPHFFFSFSFLPKKNIFSNDFKIWYWFRFKFNDSICSICRSLDTPFLFPKSLTKFDLYVISFLIHVDTKKSTWLFTPFETYVECISSIHFSLFGQSDQKQKNQLSCLFTFFSAPESWKKT